MWGGFGGWFDWEDDWDPVPRGPHTPGCAFHDGKCGGDQVFEFQAPAGALTMVLCENHITKLRPQDAGFQVIYEPFEEVVEEVVADSGG